MTTVGLYGSSSSGVVASASGSESTGLYGNSTNFGGTYFEWFIFQVSDTQPATPTGGSWDFVTNSGTPPSGWTNTPIANPLNTVWVSIALVNSKNASNLIWSSAGKFAYSSGLPVLSGNGTPDPTAGQSDQLYIQLDTSPQTIWFKESGTWTCLSGSSIYVDTTSNQTIAGTKTFSSQIQGSISGTSSNVSGIVDISHGGTGSTTASAARGALGAAASGANSDITSLSGLTTPLNVIQGGTGAGSLTGYVKGNGVSAMTASATVPVTDLSGTVAITQGGTGATTASGARTNLGAAASGSNSDITSLSGITNGISTPDYIQFDVAPTTTPSTPGALYWDSADGNKTLSLVMDDGSVVQQIGEEQYYRIKASSAISNGQVVMFSGTVGNSGALTGAPASGLTASTASYVMGIATQDLTLNGWGYVTSFGLVRGIDTTGGAEGWVDGQILYYNPSVAGGLTKNVPTAPNAKVQVCAVVKAATNGSVFVRPSFGGQLGQYEGDVEISSPAAYQLLQRNSTNTRWENVAASSVTVGNVSGTVATNHGGTGLTSFTANGVVYASSTSALTTGSALTFDGTNLNLGVNGATIYWTAAGNNVAINTSSGVLGFYTGTSSYGLAQQINADGTTLWKVGGSEQMRLTSTGLGIGTSSPGKKLDVEVSGSTQNGIRLTTGGLELASFTTSGSTGEIRIGGTSAPAGAFFPVFYANGAERMRLDTSGNLGLGVTPSAWATSGRKVLQIGTGGAGVTHFAGGGGVNVLSNNVYFDGTNSIYINNGVAQQYIQSSSGHVWNTAPSGTAGNPITFTQAMTLDASGRLCVGLTANQGANVQVGTSLTDNVGSIPGCTVGSRLIVTSYGSSPVLSLGYYSSGYGADIWTNASGLGDLYIDQRNSAAVIFRRNTQGGTTYESARIDSSGNLLVGTASSTNGKITVLKNSSYNSHSGHGLAFLSNDANAYTSLYMGVDDAYNVGYLQTAQHNIGYARDLAINPNGGNLLVGTTSVLSNAKVGVLFNGASTYGMEFKTSSGTGTQYYINFLNSSTAQIGSIYGSTTTTTYSTSSDYRLKHDIAPMTGALERVAALKPVTYKWNADNSDGEGFIAHELAEVCPHAVTGEKDAVDSEGKPLYQGIDTSFLVATLTAAIQEQQAQIEALTARLAALEAK